VGAPLAEVMGQFPLRGVLQILPGSEAELPHLLRGDGPDPVKVLDIEPGDKGLLLLRRHDGESVGFAPACGDLRDELRGADAGGRGQARLFVDLFPEAAGDQGAGRRPGLPGQRAGRNARQKAAPRSWPFAPRPEEACYPGLTYKIPVKESSHVVFVPARLFPSALDADERL